MKIKSILLAIGLFCLSAVGYAAEEKPAFLQPEVLKAAVAINLTDEQKPMFQSALSDMVDGRVKAMNKLLRGNNVTNMPRKMKSKTNSLLKKMDKAMAKFLTPEQMPAYENYRDTLKSHMRGM